MQNEVTKYYKIADICYKINFNNAQKYTEDNLLCEYISDREEPMHTLDVYVTDTLPEPEGRQTFADNHKVIYINEDGSQMRFDGVLAKDAGSAYMCICRNESLSRVYVKPQAYSSKTLLKAMELEHFLANNKGVLFHSAYIEVNGKALLFTAPSGVGKSTQADLWVKERDAELINGDRCALKIKDGKVFAFGVPYCGSSGVRKNRALEVQAIVYLVRAKEPFAKQVSGVKAFLKLYEGICVNTWNSADMESCVQTLTTVAENTPVFILECTPDGLSVAELEKALKEMKSYDEYK